MTRSLRWLAAMLLSQVLVTGLHAQSNYPAGTITIVVPTAAGGTSDGVVRLLAKSLQDSLKQPVVISNRPGASGQLGSKLVQRSQPDGHTLLFTSVSTLVTGPLLADPVPFDVVKDFTPIGRVVDYPLFIMTGSGIKAKDLQQLVNETKQKKRGLMQAVPGVGSMAHLACAAFASAAGIELLVIPYKSSGMAKQALISNEVDVGCMSAEGTGQFVADGRIRLIAALSPSRNVDHPEVPTAIESGFPGLTARVWLGLFAPKGTPDDVIRKLHRSLQSALRAPELIAFARAQSMDIIQERPAEAAAAIRSDQERWAKIIKDKRTAFKE